MDLVRRTIRLVVHAGVALVALAIAPLTTFANDLSDSPCTAEDVEIVGAGIVVNEPCSCTPGGTFNARVQFTVRNNTSTGRYCISLHLVPDGGVLTTATDVLLKDVNGKSTAPGKSGGERFHDTVMYGTIANFPCNMGVVCFGQTGTVRGKCDPGTCTTVAWNTSSGAATCTTPDEAPPGGQCRHQQVCIVGYGATLGCVSGCNAICGSAATLRACVTAPISRGPFTLRVTGSDGSTQTQSTVGDSSGTVCVNFNVTPTQSPKTTYTLTVTDRDSCTRSDTTTVSVTPTVATITPPANPGCNGILAYSASVTGLTGCTFTWTIDGQTPAAFVSGGAADDARVARASGASFQFRALDNVCHTIRVSASCPSGGGRCTASASTTAKQWVGSTLNCN